MVLRRSKPTVITKNSRTKLDSHVPDDGGTYLDFRVINYNCHSLINFEERVERFLRELEGTLWDAIVFTETWREELEEFWETKWGHTWYGSGGSKGSKGVGVLLHRRSQALQFESVDSRLCRLDISVAGVILCIVAVYMPHGNYSDDDVEAVYECLDDIAASARSQSRFLLVAGDSNCHSGAWDAAKKLARLHLRQLVYFSKSLRCKYVCAAELGRIVDIF